MKFRIEGADRETAKDVEIIVDARDEVHAETIASRRNVMVSSVVLVRSPRPDPHPSPPVASKKGGKPAHDPLRFLAAAVKEASRNETTGATRKQCPKCKELINKAATKCPHCRSQQPSPPWAYAIAALLVILPAFLCFGLCSGLLNSPSVEQAVQESEQYGSDTMAWVMAQDYVKDRLKSPGSADFGGWLEQTTSKCVTDLGQGRYRVEGWVDSQNSFGAILRTHFTCIMKYRGDTMWACESIDLTQ